MALLRAATFTFACCLFACPPRGGGQLLEDGRNAPLLADGSPAPEPCPQDAKAAMRALRLRVGASALAEIDMNRREQEPLTVFSGPVESVLEDPLDSIDRGSRFYGRIWVSKRGVVI